MMITPVAHADAGIAYNNGSGHVNSIGKNAAFDRRSSAALLSAEVSLLAASNEAPFPLPFKWFVIMLIATILGIYGLIRQTRLRNRGRNFRLNFYLRDNFRRKGI